MSGLIPNRGRGSFPKEGGPSHVVPISLDVGGHLSTAALLSPVVWLFWWLLSKLLSSPLSGSLSLALTAAAVVVSSIVVTLCERPFTVSAGHSDPGGWGYAIWGFVIPPLVGAMVGWFVSPGHAACGAIAMFTVFGTEALLLKTWRPGMSDEEIRQAWSKTKKMTEEMAAEDRIERGWLTPPRKWNDQ